MKDYYEVLEKGKIHAKDKATKLNQGDVAHWVKWSLKRTQEFEWGLSRVCRYLQGGIVRDVLV